MPALGYQPGGWRPRSAALAIPAGPAGLEDLLSDDVIQAMMDADGVDAGALRCLVATISRRRHTGFDLP